VQTLTILDLTVIQEPALGDFRRHARGEIVADIHRVNVDTCLPDASVHGRDLCTSSSVLNCSQTSSSSRNRPLNDSQVPFCHGDPGSMKSGSTPVNRHRSVRAWAVSSEPLSEWLTGLTVIEASRSLSFATRSCE
jgi:hypothetical protein